MSQRLRILGLTPDRTGKTSGFHVGLQHHADVIGIVRPVLPRIEYFFNRLRTFHPDLRYWKQHASLNPWVFKRRSAIVANLVEARRDQFDVIVQIHTLFAPGLAPIDKPFVIVTDNTYMLSERYYSPWAPLRNQRQRAERIRLEKLTYDRAAFLLPYSERTRQSLIEDYGVLPEKVVTVGAGTNLQRPNIDGKRYDKQIALFVGGDFERKGGQFLLRAWQHVRRQLPDAELWIVGPRRKRGLDQPGVRWLGFVTRGPELSHLYDQASVFVMPSLFEPWGHVFQEAMGHALPCIGTDVCAMPEIIAHNETGLLVPRGTVVPLADALVALLNNPSLAEVMGRRAYTRVRDMRSWKDIAAGILPYLELAVQAQHKKSNVNNTLPSSHKNLPLS